MSYRRVVPRDLFNEAKLLKCLGKLALYILDSEEGCAKVLSSFHRDSRNQGFIVVQNPHDATLSCSNMGFYHNSFGELHLYIPYNNKTDSWPLWFDHNGESERVFTEEGAFTPEFMQAMEFGYDV